MDAINGTDPDKSAKEERGEMEFMNLVGGPAIQISGVGAMILCFAALVGLAAKKRA